MAQLKDLLVTGPSRLIGDAFANNFQAFRVTSDWIPITNNVYSLGSSSLKWKDIYATSFHGTLDGSAASLTNGHVFKVQDSYAAYTGAEVVFNGTQDVTLKLNKDTKFDNIRVVTTVRPETTNTGTLGNSSYYWKGAYISGREGSIHWNSLISVNSANNNPIVNVNTDRGLPRIFGRGDSYRPSNPFFGIPRSSIKVELTTNGGATWTDYSSVLDVRHFYNENGMSATPGLNTAGTSFDQYDATSTSSTTGGGSSATYAANYWKNKGIRITFDTWDEYRYGWVDCIRLRFGTAGTNNKSHYIIER